jgi:hypothetical protein
MGIIKLQVGRTPATINRRTGNATAPAVGIALGLRLAWAIGVSFPIFAPG